MTDTAQHTPCHIHVVEDSAIQAEVLRRSLVKAGYAVTVARDGAEGLAKALEVVPTLVISDIMMPILDGFELCRKIKAEPSLDGIPVILLTSLTNTGDVLRGLESGADNFITKPYDNRQLLEHVTSALSGRDTRHDDTDRERFETTFAGKRYVISADRRQVMNTLLTTYETAGRKNEELLKAQEELRSLNEDLEHKIRERTAALTGEIAERKRLQEKYQTLFDEMQEGFALHEIICDATEQPCDYRFLTVNQAFERLTGLSAADIEGRTAREIMPGIESRWIETYGRVALTGEPVSFEEYAAAFGKYFSVNAFRPVPNQFACVFSDITERKQAEMELLLVKEAAEAANQAKSRFLANMSHELRTPLNGVLGMIQLTQFGELDERQQEYLKMALNSGHALVRILNDILDLSKIEVQKITLAQERFSLRECVSEAHDVLLSEAVRKGLEFTLSVADSLPGLVVGDQVRLRQVLTNLIGNAVKFTAQGKVAIQVAPGSGGITFTVTDTGIGIPADKRYLLFQRFSQVDDSLTRNYGGAGLGLAISRELVELMGGTITCDSTEGVGSAFTVTIPLGVPEVPAPVTPPQPATTPATAGKVPSFVKQPRILVVEDDPTNRALLQLSLKRQCFDVETAVNGVQAVEKWEQGNYDLIIMDVQMPVMDGVVATETIRERERIRGGHIPILAMTAHAYGADIERCLTAGMDDYLSKPVDIIEINQVITKLLELEDATMSRYRG